MLLGKRDNENKKNALLLFQQYNSSEMNLVRKLIYVSFRGNSKQFSPDDHKEMRREMMSKRKRR